MADFAFQFEWVLKSKQKGFKGIAPHIFILLLCSIVLLLPVIHNLIFDLFLISVLFIHWLIDAWKTKLNNLKNKDNIFIFLFDQILHLIVISPAIFIKVDIVKFNLNLPQFLELFYILYYSNKFMMIFSIYLFIGFTGFIYKFFLENIFLGKFNVNTYSLKKDYYEILERVIILSSALIYNIFYTISIGVVLFFIKIYVVKNNKLNKIKKKIILITIIIDYIIPGIIGYFIKRYLII